MMTLSRWKIFAVVASAIFGLLFTLPNLVPANVLAAMPSWLPHQKLNLGLDLQGGSYLLLEVDTNALRAERLTNLSEEVGTTLRNGNIAITDPALTNGVVSVRVTNPDQVNAAVSLLRKNVGAPLAGVAGGNEVVISTRSDQRIEAAFSPATEAADAAKAVEQSIEIIRRRIDSLGTKEPAIIRQGANRIVVQAPGESDPEKLKNIIGQTAKLTFQMVDETVSPEDIAAGRIPRRVMQLPSEDGYAPSYILERRILVSGEMLTDARQEFDQQTGQPQVSFRFNGAGAQRFGEVTGKNIGRRFAIVLDNKVISAPVIQSAITGGSGRITGNFTPETANNLAVLLRSGALPAPLTVEDQRTVTAELGADAVKAGSISLAIGAVSMVVFILLAYGLFGVFAAIALVVNVLMIIGIMSLTQATLTFPGIAGLILTLAVAVDANVLIYERMRDEAHAGRTAMAAADVGFSRALVSIMDANITSLISALIMFQFGSGPVRGFAWTLAIGVVCSVFTAVLITQVLISWWFRVTRPKTLPIA
jgi:preprotein translocase subunit SecD